MGNCASTPNPPPRFDSFPGPQGCPTYNVALLGEAAVGKTTIAAYCETGYAPRTTDPTVGTLQRTVSLEDNEKNPFQITFIDVPGDVSLANCSMSCLHLMDAIWFVWDCSELLTLEAMNDWLRRIRDCTSENVPIFIIGNKYDLSDRVNPETATELIRQASEIFPNLIDMEYTSAFDPMIGVSLRDVMITTKNNELVQEHRKDRLAGAGVRL